MNFQLEIVRASQICTIENFTFLELCMLKNVTHVIKGIGLYSKFCTSDEIHTSEICVSKEPHLIPLWETDAAQTRPA